MLPSKFGVNWLLGLGEEAKNRFLRWLPWRPSWISDQHDFSYSGLTVYFFGNIGHWPKVQTNTSNIYVQRVTKLYIHFIEISITLFHCRKYIARNIVHSTAAFRCT